MSAGHCIQTLNDVFQPLIYALRSLSAQSSLCMALYTDTKWCILTLDPRIPNDTGPRFVSEGHCIQTPNKLLLS